VVNDWIDEDAPKRSKFCYANMVECGSLRAITELHSLCPRSSLERLNVILMTRGADFGDDIELTDSLTDRLFVLEGGVQSFIQAVNCLVRGCMVTLLGGLRREEVSSRFSASVCLRKLSVVPTESCFEQYMRSCFLSDAQIRTLHKAFSRLMEMKPSFSEQIVNVARE
jgi:hypothetical protein